MFRYYEVAVTRFFNPLVGNFFMDAAETVRALKELKKSPKSSEFNKGLTFQIELMHEKYQYLLNQTNLTVVQVNL